MVLRLRELVAEGDLVGGRRGHHSGGRWRHTVGAEEQEPLAGLLASTGYAALISRSIFSMPNLALSMASTLLLPKLKTRTLMSKML